MDRGQLKRIRTSDDEMDDEEDDYDDMGTITFRDTIHAQIPQESTSPPPQHVTRRVGDPWPIFRFKPKINGEGWMPFPGPMYTYDHGNGTLLRPPCFDPWYIRHRRAFWFMYGLRYTDGPWSPYMTRDILRLIVGIVLNESLDLGKISFARKGTEFFFDRELLEWFDRHSDHSPIPACPTCLRPVEEIARLCNHALVVE